MIEQDAFPATTALSIGTKTTPDVRRAISLSSHVT